MSSPTEKHPRVAFGRFIFAAAVAALLAGSCDPPTPPPPRVQCGGIAAFPCPGAGSCVDDPADSCDPRGGGADCGGLCQCNAIGLCVEGYRWDPSPAVCACVPAEPVACGPNTCAAGQVCCNASCGICTPPDGVCIQIACE